MLEHGVIIDDANVFNDKLQQWEDLYNFDRPHGGLGVRFTPFDRQGCYAAMPSPRR